MGPAPEDKTRSFTSVSSGGERWREKATLDCNSPAASSRRCPEVKVVLRWAQHRRQNGSLTGDTGSPRSEEISQGNRS